MKPNEERAHLRRSFLFVPGSEEKKVAKAASLGADAVILDLEDAVAPARKAEARTRLRTFLQGQDSQTIEWLIRLNGISTPYFEADLEACVRAGPDALVIPKVDSPEVLQLADAHLTEAEHASSCPAGSLRFFALIESARGILNAHAIATATPRLLGLMLGHVDLSTDLGIPAGRAGEGIVHHARCQLVLAARAAAVDVVDTIYLNIHDHEGLRAEAAQAAAMGFAGKLAIHPGQIPIIHEAFTPSADRVQRAKRVLEVWRQAEMEGRGVCALDGELIEKPVVEAERRVLERARMAGIV
ncbi:MAG: CoA ester lyase [Candidatus Methylomirabilota bacterium]